MEQEHIGEHCQEKWTKEEKFQLLQAIKAFGSDDIEEIQHNIPTKSEDDISRALQFYKSKIKITGQPVLKKKTHTPKDIFVPKIPLASWAKYLTNSLTYDELYTETSAALRLIADLEDIPSSIYTENIDFRKIYHQIANAMDGKELVEDKTINGVLSKCIVETALTSKAFIRNSTLRHIVSSFNISVTGMNVYPKPTNNNEMVTLRHLTSQRNFNPLNVSEEYLVPCIHKP